MPDEKTMKIKKILELIHDWPGDLSFFSLRTTDLSDCFRSFVFCLMIIHTCEYACVLYSPSQLSQCCAWATMGVRPDKYSSESHQ